MFWLTYILCNCINSTEERIEGKWIFRTRWSTAASNLFHMYSPAESLCAVSMTQAAVLTDTLHVENIHQSKLLHTCDICPPSSVQKTPTNTQMTDQMVQMAKAQKITYPPPTTLSLPPASSQPPYPSPDMLGTHSEGFPLIFSSPPGNQHFNNSLSAEDGIWCFHAHHHPSSFLSLISQHPSESEAKTWKRQNTYI